MNSSTHDISSFVLKIIAIVCMTCNHVYVVFAQSLTPPVALLLCSLGGITFPVMALLLTEGFVYTSNLKRYMTRLFVFALIAQIPYSLLWGPQGNVLFTLLIGLIILYVKREYSRTAFFAALIGGVALSGFCDWGIIGPLLIVVFHALRDQEAHGRTLAMLVPLLGGGLPACAQLADVIQVALASNIAIAATLGAISTPTASLPLAAISLTTAACTFGYNVIGYGLATLLIRRYQHRRGPSLKWFFYVYYPAHLLILWLIKVLV